MIPLLYRPQATTFPSTGLNALCRLYDCIECTVLEERNGIYEASFSYPLNGRNFEEIRLGRIIAIEHGSGNDLQPFDIVSYSRPIDGIVTFNCQHVSYRQSKIVVTTLGSNPTFASTVLQSIKTHGSPSNPFTYSTDLPSVARVLPCADGIPKTAKSILGGTDGSLLDTFGGEFEWDKFAVKLHESRGTRKDFTIRYGVNMTDYLDEADYSESYTAVVPYWSGTDENDQDVIVVGDLVDSGLESFNSRTECIPLDLSGNFETEPTTAELETFASSYITSNNINLPLQTITVNFLEDEDGINVKKLHDCHLCDIINVQFPAYRMTGDFKIVKTEYDVLNDRFTTFELGALKTTLAQALGISK